MCMAADVIQPGDNPMGIECKFGMSFDAFKTINPGLCDANNNCRILFPGPGEGTWQVPLLVQNPPSKNARRSCSPCPSWQTSFRFATAAGMCCM